MALRKWGQETQVNTQVIGIQANSQVGSLADGGFVVVWQENNAGVDDSNTSIRMQRYAANGQKVGVESLVNTTTLNSQQQPSLAILANGNILVSWQDNSNALGTAGDIRFRRFNADGSAVDIVDVALPHASFQFDADATHLSNDGFAISFSQQSNGNDIFLDILAADGTSQHHIAVATSAIFENQGSVAQLTDGRLILTWQDTSINQIRMQIVDATTGALVGGPVNVTTVANSPGNAEVTALAGGGFVVTWQDTNQPLPDDQSSAVRARVFSAGSPPVGGGEFTVNTLPFSNQDTPAPAALPDGGFAVVYESQGLGGLGRIMVQLFNANGSKRGGEYVVDTESAVSDSKPTISVLADGRLVVTWENSSSTPNDPSGGIVMQIIDPRDGLVIGSENAETLFGNDVYGDEINGFGGADVLHGLAGSDTLYGGGDNDSLFGGRDSDTLFGGADQDSLIGGLGADEIDGGDGVDTANYALAAFAVTASLDGTLLGTNEALDDTYVSIENLTGTNIAAQADILRGNAGANSIAGLAGADSLNGVSGHDRLTGGAGVDTMTGGSGNDSFIFNTLTEGGDIITDFSSFATNNNDVFRFKGSVFGGLAAGAITAPQFQSSTSNVAANATVDFFYETDTRILRFDADGSGAGAAVTIATLQAGATMTVNDILIF